MIANYIGTISLDWDVWSSLHACSPARLAFVEIKSAEFSWNRKNIILARNILKFENDGYGPEIGREVAIRSRYGLFRPKCRGNPSLAGRLGCWLVTKILSVDYLWKNQKWPWSQTTSVRFRRNRLYEAHPRMQSSTFSFCWNRVDWVFVKSKIHYFSQKYNKIRKR